MRHLEESGTTLSNIEAKTLLQDMGLQVTDHGVRSTEDQEAYYNSTQGVSAPGTSLHERGNAIDIRVPDDITTEEIVENLEARGFKGVTIITKQHGTGPHWHIQWDSGPE